MIQAQAKWILPAPVQVDEELQAIFPAYPVIAQILARRGYTSHAHALAFLYPQHFVSSDPFDFPGMQYAVQLVLNCITQKQPIGICGDFDVDGLIATALLYEGLRKMSCEVFYQFPGRPRESHGISEETVKSLIERGCKLMITCDTGVTEHSSIQMARQNNMEVIITDHHPLTIKPPDANALINPEMLPEKHPMRTLSGAGIAYKLIEAVFRFAGSENSAGQLLDLAAIGMIADQVPLKGEARYLVQLGIECLKKTCRPGLVELINQAKISAPQINEKTISHMLAPRLNSLGSMHDANQVVELLTTTDGNRARCLASQAEFANTARKQMTDTITMAAQNIVERDREVLEKPLIILESSEWQSSVIGMVASQISQRYNRPVVVISSPAGRKARGSARSIAGIDIAAAICANRQYLEHFGGHAKAAGFTIEQNNLLAFKRALSATIFQMNSVIQNSPEQIAIDAFLSPQAASDPEFVTIMQQFRPYGPGNSTPNFLATDLEYVDAVAFGNKIQHRKMNLMTRYYSRHPVIWWNGANQPLPTGNIDLVYRISQPTTGGQTEAQISLVDYKLHESTVDESFSGPPSMDIIDWRNKTIDDAISLISDFSVTALYGEGFFHQDENFPIKNRLEGTLSNELILLTCPPDYHVLAHLMQTIRPIKVYVVARQTDLDNKLALVQFVTGQVLKSIHDDNGKMNTCHLAARTGHTEKTVQLLIEWLASKTNLHYLKRDKSEIVLDNSGQPGGNVQQCLDELEKSLQETLAFKRFVYNSDPVKLLQKLEEENRSRKKTG